MSTNGFVSIGTRSTSRRPCPTRCCDVDILGLEPAAWRRAGVGGIARIADHAVDDQPVPDKEHEQRAKRRADEASTLIEPIPTDSLADERGEERACDSQHRCEDEAFRLVRTRGKYARDQTGNEADDDDPDDVPHDNLPQRRWWHSDFRLAV